MSTDQAILSGTRAWARLAVAWAWLFLCVSCATALTTVAGGEYRGLLLTAISCAGVATLLLAFGVWRGGAVARVFAVLAVAPLLFIASEFLRRF